MFCIKETCLILLVIATYLGNCKTNANSANFQDTTGKYEEKVNTDGRSITENDFGANKIISNETVMSENNKTEEEEDNSYYYEYSDRVLYLDSVSRDCYIIMSPIFLIVGTAGNFSFNNRITKVSISVF